MKAYVSFGTIFYLIEFEPFMGKNIKKYQEEFEKYFYVEKVVFHNGKKYVNYEPKKMCWGIEEIFDWMREMSTTSNPRILGEYILGEKYDKKIPGMYF